MNAKLVAAALVAVGAAGCGGGGHPTTPKDGATPDAAVDSPDGAAADAGVISDAGDAGDAGDADAARSDGAVDLPLPGDAAAPDARLACDPATRWPVMLAQTIVPPRRYAGLDLAGDDSWRGLTLEQAEAINCVSQPINRTTSAWGARSDVEVFYDPDTRLIREVVLHADYAGTLTFKDRAAAHTYVVTLSHPITKDGAPFLIDWGGPNQDATLTEIYNAIMGPNGPGVAVQPSFVDSTNCRIDRGCLVIADDGTGVAYFGARPLGVYFNFRAGDPQPQVSSPFQLYQIYSKTEPYTAVRMTYKLDAIGPAGAGTAAPITGCSVQTGLSWQKFLPSCVQVSGDATIDQLKLTQLTGGLRHDLETWTTTGLVLDPVIEHAQGAFDVIQDATPIAGTDTVTGWLIDQDPPGRSANEVTASGTLDLHGSGLLVREWARLVQNDINALTGGRHALGDTTCFGASPAAGCTGFEGIILPGLPYASDPAAFTDLIDPGFYSQSLLTPSAVTPMIVFCADPGLYSSCTQGSIFATALARVTHVLGRDVASSLPPALQDRRYFLRLFARALVRYLRAYGVSGAALTPPLVAAATEDTAAYAFSQEGDGPDPLDTFSYVERSFVSSASPAPLAFEVAWDLTGDAETMRQLRWFSRIDRTEAALLGALATKKSNPPGLENNVNPTNVFGSRLLRNSWPSYRCATVVDPASCGAVPSLPIDPDSGAPTLLVPYPGAWGRTLFSGGGTTMKVVSTSAVAGSARINLPNYADPYAVGTADPPATIDVLVPWKGGKSYVVPTSATADRTITGDEVHFGSKLFDLDVLYQVSAGGIVVEAIHSKKFMGGVFLCSDGTTGAPIVASSYTSGRALADWVTRHPADAAGCGMVVRRRPGGEIDSITSTASSVKVTMSRGGGGGDGRAIDVVLWDPRF